MANFTVSVPLSFPLLFVNIPLAYDPADAPLT